MKKETFLEFLNRYTDIRGTMMLQIGVAILMLAGGIASYNVMNTAVFIIWTSFFTLMIPVIILRAWLIYNRNR